MIRVRNDAMRSITKKETVQWKNTPIASPTNKELKLYIPLFINAGLSPNPFANKMDAAAQMKPLNPVNGSTKEATITSTASQLLFEKNI